MKKVIDLYRKLCDYYIEHNGQAKCSLQHFLNYRYTTEKNAAKKQLLKEVINYAAKDNPM